MCACCFLPRQAAERVFSTHGTARSRPPVSPIVSHPLRNEPLNRRSALLDGPRSALVALVGVDDRDWRPGDTAYLTWRPERAHVVGESR